MLNNTNPLQHDVFHASWNSALSCETFDADRPPAVKHEIQEAWFKSAKRANRCVNYARVIVLLALVVSAVLTSKRVCSYVSNDQHLDFAYSFAANAEKIVEGFQNAVSQQLLAADALSLAMTSYALASGVKFPFLLLPDYDKLAGDVRSLSYAEYVSYYPVVRHDQREEWHEFSGQTDHSTSGLDACSSGSDAFSMPLWQTNPTQSKFTSSLGPDGSLAKTVVQEKLAVLGSLYMGAMDKELNLRTNREASTDCTEEPTSILAYPVFDSFDVKNRRIVGVLAMKINWGLVFGNITTADVGGMLCVIQNCRNQTSTFHIGGSDIPVLNKGDLHDPKYNDHRRSAGMQELIRGSLSAKALSYSSVLLKHRECAFDVHIYPSKSYEETFVNDDPRVLALIINGIFIFTSLVFIAYDCFVGQRQRNLMERAVTSSAIVASLFPEEVREQVYKEEQLEQEKARSPSRNSAKRRFSLTMRNQKPNIEESRQIASRFDHTTIFFADLSGLNKWSEDRAAEDVFELLELLFGKFDRAAKRRGVFKVETNGDCYFAVTGVPDPDEKHVVRCAKFAMDCIRATREVMDELAWQFGEDTSKLELRVGLHSGPVTAGVLRGEKVRFQLYGDVVNTAARMKSTSLPGFIQVSSDTATELMSHGKSDWLDRRSDPIMVKGKGEMQTYWVNPETEGSSELTFLKLYSLIDSLKEEEDDKLDSSHSSLTSEELRSR